MNVLGELKQRFQTALDHLSDDPSDLLDMVRNSQDVKFGDYQANCAMPLGKRRGEPPRDVAARLVELLEVDDMCLAPQIAGPGFINLQLRDDWISGQLDVMRKDARLGVTRVDSPQTFVVDYSSPNVAKAMHVGHIRSTVLGDAICRTLRFLGHQVISDNHLGDWGTQFGMIIYGYKHFLDESAYAESPVQELGRLYRLVHQLTEYHRARHRLPEALAAAEAIQADLDQQVDAPADPKPSQQKKQRKIVNNLRTKLRETQAECDQLTELIERIEADPELKSAAESHPNIGQSALQETAQLHAGDPQNLQLWKEFLPQCRQDIQRIYDRLDIRFDYEHGESYYHEMLGDVVREFQQRDLAVTSEGAICIFLEGFAAPMLIQKKDGAFLYATTDLATIQYRMSTWQPDVLLYVVDFRQGEHFDKLFAAARLLGYQVDMRHISFGTVMGKDGKPYRTRSGDTVGLEGLLDEAVAKAYGVVCENDESKPDGPQFDEAQRRHIARVVGHAAIKYADLSHNRTSDYVFDEDKMVAMQGNTATYMQYSYARTQSIFARGNIDVESLREAPVEIRIEHPRERDLAIQLLRFQQAVEEVVVEFRPNQLTGYLFNLADSFSKFFEQCSVLKAETESLRDSRLLLCDLTGRTIKTGLGLLGIDVVDKM